MAIVSCELLMNGKKESSSEGELLNKDFIAMCKAAVATCDGRYRREIFGPKLLTIKSQICWACK